MEFKLLSAELVVAIHDAILTDAELAGMARDKSLEGALGRVEFRISYGFITDAFDVAAMYAVALAQAHAFNDGNKRTAFVAMAYTLEVHGIYITFDTKTVGDMIISVAQGKVDETDLAAWLRTQANAAST